ncbi:MAG TPA: hypothetical protein VFK94_05280 [Patescibacteria group bacterium]|nr:hypothetical protein [Patescibacteria group bacterium]
MAESRATRFTSDEALENMLGFHPATDEAKPLYVDIRKEFTELAKFLNDILPESREKSLAFTKLQEAQMFAIGSVAIHTTPLVREQ